MTHTVDPQLLERPIRILVVGCGGNGSAIVSGLPYLHQALLAFGHPGGLAVTLIDPDTVSETNCVRQPFCRTEIGFPKAIVLAHRINLFWGLNWQGMQATIQQLKKGSDVDFVIGCVDTRKARRAIDKWVLNSRVLYWLDLGNNASSGQFVLGQPKNSANRKKKDRLPTVAELYPEILKRDKKEDDQPSCSAAEALTRQEPFINQNLAYQALGMLTQLLRHGSVSYQGGFCNLATGQLVPLAVGKPQQNCSLVAIRPDLRTRIAIAVVSKPAPRWRIERRLVEVAQQRDRVSFDLSAQAGWTRFVIDGQPQERHVTDDFAYRALQFDFRNSNILRGRTALTPCREFVPIASDQCRSDDQPEYRAAVICRHRFEAGPCARTDGPRA